MGALMSVASEGPGAGSTRGLAPLAEPASARRGQRSRHPDHGRGSPRRPLANVRRKPVRSRTQPVLVEKANRVLRYSPITRQVMLTMNAPGTFAA